MCPKRESPDPVLLRTEVAVVQYVLGNGIARNLGRRGRRHVVHQEPSRRGGAHAALKFRDQIAEARLMSVVTDHCRERGECLTWRAADHAIEHAGRRVKTPDIATPQHVWA